MRRLLVRSGSAILLVGAALCAAPASARAQRQDQLLATGWKFIRQDAALDADPAAWEKVTLPHCWNAAEVDRGRAGNPGFPAGYYRGPGTYELDLMAPAAWRGHRVFVQFEAASVKAQVWLNGHDLGEHRGAFTAFCFELTPYLQLDGRNELRVRVDNSPDETIPPLSGDFNLCGGIYRPVHLLVTDPVCITPLEFGAPGVYVHSTRVAAESAAVEVEARLASAEPQPVNVRVNFRIRDAAGVVVAEAGTPLTVPARSVLSAVQHLAVRQPHRWQGRADPYLYTVEASLERDGQPVDAVVQPLGFRTLAITPDRGVLLNGQPYPIHGVNRHQDLQGKGWALTDADHDRDFAFITEMGATAVRLAHYPQAFHVYDLADRLGLLVWNEISLVDYVRATPAFAANAEQQLREMILQRCNHPAVMCWGLFNELRAPDAKVGLELIRHLNAVANSLDASRPTVCASNLMSKQPIHGVTDWIAFNAYPGWYGNLAKDTMATFLEKRQADLGGKRIAVSEYGAGGSPNQHEEGEVKRPVTNSRWHPEEWQTLVHERDWRDIRTNQSRLWGTFLWSMFDFAAAKRNEGEHTGMNDKGMVTRDRAVRKDVFYFYKANWTTTPLVYITSRRLIERQQAVTPVKVYSNCDVVELFVNGRSAGTVHPDDIQVAQWPAVTLHPGTNDIAVVGRRGAAQVRDACRWTLNGPTITAADGKTTFDVKTAAWLTEVQQDSVRYFYDFGHPVSGLTRVGTERPPEYCEIGGTGWGCFNLIVAAERGFVPRAAVAARAHRMIRFLRTKADRFHGAFPHWMNGETGRTIAFNQDDDGADLVETGFLMEGLLALREYFTGNDRVETEIRAGADQLWRDVDWTWFAKEIDGRAVLLWHWSPRVGFKKNMAVQGFNETQIIYLLALGSPTHPVPVKYYWQGWQGGGARFSTPREDFGIPMTLGRGSNMPLFFAHYSYLGFDPHALSFNGRSYFDHLRDLCRVQIAYAQSNAGTFQGYGPLWGLTACRGPKGYRAYAPGPRDDGTVAPTAALSSMPYVPAASLAFLAELERRRDTLWAAFGPADSFNLARNWIVQGYLGNDIGTIAPMIENFRSGLCWSTFMKAPEIGRAVQLVRDSEPKAPGSSSR